MEPQEYVEPIEANDGPSGWANVDEFAPLRDRCHAEMVWSGALFKYVSNETFKVELSSSGLSHACATASKVVIIGRADPSARDDDVVVFSAALELANDGAHLSGYGHHARGVRAD